jgi:hypothetical protein
MNTITEVFIEGTPKTPHVDFNPLSGEMILSGRSIPENAAKIYEPLLAWTTDYIKSPKPTTNFRLSLEYFNTASMLWISRLIKLLGRIEKDDSVVFIHIYIEREEYENMDTEDLKDLMMSLIDNVSDSNVSIGVKVYGTEISGEVTKESLIFVS